mmetsp:Transcript_124786/g.313910  ORF Transcript_124786/g.313910 Transcript_124786/m.313910 type:complete len:83 (+) Transcript_124786:505-753(+)
MPSKCLLLIGATNTGATLNNRLQSPITRPCNMAIACCAELSALLAGALRSAVESSTLTIQRKGLPAEDEEDDEGVGRPGSSP